MGENKKTISTRLSPDTKEMVEDYAEELGLTQSEAARRMIKKGIDLENAGLTVAASDQTESNDEDGELVTDGGQNVRPMLRFLGSLYAFLSISILGVMLLAGSGVAALSFVDYNSLFGVMMSSFLLLAIIMIVLTTSYPEKADRLVNMWVRKVSHLNPVQRWSKA